MFVPQPLCSTRLRVQEMAVFLATPGAVAMSLATDIGHLVQKSWWCVGWFMVGVSIFGAW